VGAAPAGAQTPEPVGERFVIEGGAGFWNPTAEMSIQSESLGILGTEIDFKRDLGLQDHRLSALQAVLKGGRKHKFRFQYIPLHYEQATTLVREIIFNGQRYRIGLPVESSLNGMHAAGYGMTLARNWGFAGFTSVNLDMGELNARCAEFVRLDAHSAIGIARYAHPEHLDHRGFSGIQMPDIFENYDGHYTDLDIYSTFNFSKNRRGSATARSISYAPRPRLRAFVVGRYWDCTVLAQSRNFEQKENLEGHRYAVLSSQPFPAGSRAVDFGGGQGA
jgi:hypothetical protein